MTQAIQIEIRPARREDLPIIVGLLADDALGQEREQLEDPLPASYLQAFDDLARDARNLLIVAQATDGTVLGCLQITFIPGLSYQGASRALIGGVRVDAKQRGHGIGRRMLEWAIAEARQRNCHSVQLLSHRTRIDARRFYESLGFQDSHFGMRLPLR